MYKHSELIKRIVNYVIGLFPQMKEYGACAFLSGSFSRCSCKKNSDLDFHIVYLNEYNDESIKYEEIINYMLSEILMLGRNKIHPMLLTKMHPQVLSYLENNLDNNDFNINLISDKHTINYKISGNLKRRIFLQYCKKNSIETVMNYIKNEIENDNREWAHVICPITLCDKFYSYYDELYNYEKEIISKERIINRINSIKYKINRINKQLDNDSILNISLFKKIYQKNVFDLINEYISLKRDICIYNNLEWKTINYYDNFKYLYDDSTFNKALEYMFLLFDYTEPLGNRYSLHSNEIVIIPNVDILTNKLNELNIEILNSIFKEEVILNAKNSNYYANRTI